MRYRALLTLNALLLSHCILLLVGLGLCLLNFDCGMGSLHMMQGGILVKWSVSCKDLQGESYSCMYENLVRAFLTYALGVGKTVLFLQSMVSFSLACSQVIIQCIFPGNKCTVSTREWLNMIVCWLMPRNCVTLAATLRLGRKEIGLGKYCLCHASSRAGSKNNVSTATVLAKPVVSLTRTLCTHWCVYVAIGGPEILYESVQSW